MLNLKYLSLFSGVEAASLAWSVLGWEAIAVSEIEPMCCDLLQQRYPQVPNLGNVTTVDWSEHKGKADIVVGGSPCQSFSVAGLRKSLDDDRGNLTLEFVHACNAISPGFIVWENVPGVLSTLDNALGCLLAGLVGEQEMLFPDFASRDRWYSERLQFGLCYWAIAMVNPRCCAFFSGIFTAVKWENQGFLVGPDRSLAWRILDAQHFGIPQRRRRIFLVAFDPRNAHRLVGASPGEDLRRLAGIPAAILFEPECPTGTAPPRRETGQDIAATLKGGTGERGFPLDNEAGLTLYRSGSFGDYKETQAAGTVTAKRGGAGNSGEQYLVNAFGASDKGAVDVASALLAKGGCGHLDLESETFLVQQQPFVIKGAAIGRNPENGPQYGEVLEDGTCYTLNCTEIHAIATDVMAFQERGREGGRCLETSPNLAYTLTAPKGGGRANELNIQHGLDVRRFTPVECERLMGFPDNWTNITYRGKPIADGPRYRAIGNSFAVPVVRWLGKRVETVLVALRDHFS